MFNLGDEVTWLTASPNVQYRIKGVVGTRATATPAGWQPVYYVVGTDGRAYTGTEDTFKLVPPPVEEPKNLIERALKKRDVWDTPFNP